MVTTNLPFEEWAEIVGNERMTGALLARLTHQVHIVEANGESYRLRQAKSRAASPSKKPGSKTRTSKPIDTGRGKDKSQPRRTIRPPPAAVFDRRS